MIIRSRAPVRITFGGGGTDIPPYDKEYRGLCLGATIDKYVYSSLTPRERPDIEIVSWDLNSKQHFNKLEEISYDGNCDLIKAVIKKMRPLYGFDLYVRSEIKPHSGLGASASAAVSIIGAFNHLREKDRLTKHQIAELAYIIEQEEIKNITGRQDQYAAAFGGINLYEFHGDDKVFVNPLYIEQDYILELQKNLLIARVGEKTQTSGEVHKKEKGKSNIEMLHEIKTVAEEMEYALRRGRLNDFGLLIKESSDKKVEYNPSLTTPHIDYLIDLSLRNGAIGARLMGAGTGGNLLIYCKPNKEQIVAKKLEEEGAKIIPFSFDFTGLKTWEANE
jgi:D-glycero-alpha-D-manno-heptose-7-phosphate kinase